MVQRDLKKEVLLSRDSPARDVVGMDNFAKKRALERRERAASSSSTRNVPNSIRPRINNNIGQRRDNTFPGQYQGGLIYRGQYVESFPGTVNSLENAAS